MKKYKTKMLGTLEWKYIVREDIPSYQIKRPGELYTIFGHLTRNATQEMVYAFYLNNLSRVISYEMIFKGTLSSTLMYPREIFRGAIMNNATALIVMHNHPSGEPEPSKADIEMTKRIKASGELLGIPLRDHIIFGQNNFYSMLENNNGGF